MFPSNLIYSYCYLKGLMLLQHIKECSLIMDWLGCWGGGGGQPSSSAHTGKNVGPLPKSTQ